MKSVKKYSNGGSTSKKEDRKKKKEDRKKKRAARKASRSTDMDSSIGFNMQRESDGMKGSCEDGNLRACKSKPSKSRRFNPNKKRISKSRLRPGKRAMKKRQRQEKRQNKEMMKKRNNPGAVANPRFL